jgi:hypothetical protein
MCNFHVQIIVRVEPIVHRKKGFLYLSITTVKKNHLIRYMYDRLTCYTREEKFILLLM